jgi:biopolymer transport protein ExbD
MITTPLMQHKVKIALPNASLLQKAEDRAQSLDLAIMDDGSLYLDDNLVSEMELKAQLSVAAQTTPQPEIQIRADKNTEYKQIWDVMSDAKSVGIVHLGFKTYAEKESGQ